MLASFDWIRLCRSSSELLATLKLLEKEPDLFQHQEIGPPFSALDQPCGRCHIYPRGPARDPGDYCPTCWRIQSQSRRLHLRCRYLTTVLGTLRPLEEVRARKDFLADPRLEGRAVLEDDTFLVFMQRYALRPWLQELGLYHGARLNGLLQVLPITGASGGIDSGDVLARALHQRRRFPPQGLHVRFFPSPHFMFHSHVRDQQGLLTFTLGEFLSLLEMAAIFRTLLRPEVQEILQQILELRDPGELRFYWGRFLGMLTPEARDMLAAWGIRNWSQERVKFLYELTNYVAFYSTT